MMPIHNRQGELLDISFHPGQGEVPYENALVILGHGVTGQKNDPLLSAIANALSKHGWPCVRVSFSGNGASEGHFIDSNISKEVADLMALIDQLGAGKKIAYIGHSMGGAVGALTAARDDRIKVLVSLAGMVYTRAFVDRELGDITPGAGNIGNDPDFPLSQSYVDDLDQIDNTLMAVTELRLPWLLLHGEKDEVIFPSDSRELKDRLRGPSCFIEIPGADHSLDGYYPLVGREIREWFKKFLT